jgi:hypothetical protein
MPKTIQNKEELTEILRNRGYDDSFIENLLQLSLNSDNKPKI